MSKHVIKVEFSNSEVLEKLIKKTYFENGQLGKIVGKDNFIKLDESIDDAAYAIFKGLNSADAKIVNDKIIDGSMDVLVDETQGELRLYPISIYCIKENSESKYNFF